MDDTHYNYIIVVDGGSTGSRIYIYKWLDSFSFFRTDSGVFDIHNQTLVGPSFHIFDDTNDIYKVKKLFGGVSSYSEDEKMLREKHLKPLADFAMENIPLSLHYKTPFYFLMTAGMRILDKKSQKKVINQICSYFKKNTKFYISNCKSHVKIISGDEEGIYAWISANYLMHFQKRNRRKSDFINLLEMGGASTQIVFSDKKFNKVDSGKHLYNLNLDFYEKKIKYNQELNETTSYIKSTEETVQVYSKSFLNFGLVRAQHFYHKLLANMYLKRELHNFSIKFLNSFTFTIPDPCFSKGYEKIIQYGLYNVKFFGTSDFESCNKLTEYLFKNSYDLFKMNPVSTNYPHNKVYFPSFDSKNKKFVAINGFKFSLDTMININKFISKSYKDNFFGSRKVDLNYSVENNIKHLCNLDFNKYNTFISSLKAADNHLKKETHNICFYNNWIYQVITKGFGFIFDEQVEISRVNLYNLRNSNPGHSLIFSDFINRNPLSWTLGFAYFYMSKEYSFAQIDNNLDHNKKINKRQNDFIPNPGIFDINNKPLDISSSFNNLPLRPDFRIHANKPSLTVDNIKNFSSDTGSLNLILLGSILVFFVLMIINKFFFNFIKFTRKSKENVTSKIKA